MSLVNCLSKKEASSVSSSSGQKWAKQMENCVSLLKQIGYKWVHVPSL